MTNAYQNFQVAMYTTAYDIAPLGNDITPFQERFEELLRWVKISKVYVETHRDLIIPAENTLTAMRDYLKGKGIQFAGGITVTIAERKDYTSYCYSNPEHRQKLVDVVALTARLFDDVIFDDFFFTNCKCPLCIAAKGKKSWTEFRLEQMTQASRDLVLATARKVNPKVKVTIKYPNWYEHFQGLGFNLKDQPPLYDGIYTGTETRDAKLNAQHLQPYESYLVYRYFENIKPGANRGGWVDPFNSLTLDRYAEQLWLTLYAKAPEVTLFDYRSITQMHIHESQRGPWQGQGTSFSFDEVTAPFRQRDGSLSSQAMMAAAAGAAFEIADRFIGKLGNPLGVKAYKPYHSLGEDFLHNFLGMIGIPIELTPEFPADAPVVLLTECAKYDPDIVAKIKTQLMAGRPVVITSGLLHALQEKGLRDIVEMERTDRKQSSREFLIGWDGFYTADRPILLPILHYLTNDSWAEISSITATTGSPLLHYASYGASRLYVLNIPDDFNDLYALPAGVLNRIREAVTRGLFVRLEAPSQVALFLYDNDAFVVESFLDHNTDIRLVVDDFFPRIEDVLSGETLTGEDLTDGLGQKTAKRGYAIALKPHSFRVFQAVKP
jgi:hypothetical protein